MSYNQVVLDSLMQIVAKKDKLMKDLNDVGYMIGKNITINNIEEYLYIYKNLNRRDLMDPILDTLRDSDSSSNDINQPVHPGTINMAFLDDMNDSDDVLVQPKIVQDTRRDSEIARKLSMGIRQSPSKTIFHSRPQQLLRLQAQDSKSKRNTYFKGLIRNKKNKKNKKNNRGGSKKKTRRRKQR